MFDSQKCVFGKQMFINEPQNLYDWILFLKNWLEMTEAQFRDFFGHGIVSSVRLVGIPCRVQLINVPSFCIAIEFRLASGEVAWVETKRGAAKVYRIETAINFLRKTGMKDVVVDLASLSQPEQGGLPLSQKAE